MKTKLSVLFVAALLLGAAGCAVNRSETMSRQGTESRLDLNDPRVHFLGTYSGSSTGARLLLVGGSPSLATAEKEAKALAVQDAIKKGIDPSTLRFVNANSSKGSVPLIIAGFKTERVTIEAYYVTDKPTVSAPIVGSAPLSAN